jgi:hypothetical protein
VKSVLLPRLKLSTPQFAISLVSFGLDENARLSRRKPLKTIWFPAGSLLNPMHFDPTAFNEINKS